MAMPPGTREKRGMSYGKSPGNPTTTPGPRRAVLRVYNSGTSPWACSYGCSMPPSLRSRGPRLGRAPGYGRGISGPGPGCTQVEQCCPFTTREENAMLHLDYIGLLNTDHRRKGPVQMFLQGRESHTRYVLDTLPSWVADMLGHTPESTGERRAISGANLALCNQETREALYRALVEGGYQVRPIGEGAEYREISQVFVP